MPPSFPSEINVRNSAVLFRISNFLAKIIVVFLASAKIWKILRISSFSYIFGGLKSKRIFEGVFELFENISVFLLYVIKIFYLCIVWHLAEGNGYYDYYGIEDFSVESLTL